MTPDKPFLTIGQLISHLKDDYGLLISNEKFAENALFTFSYYDLINGYQDVMMENNKFKDKISIEYLYMFHLFDKGFQNIIFKQSMMIENYFKNVLAYYVSQECGVCIEDYLNPKYYSAGHKGISFDRLATQIMDYNIKGPGAKAQPTKHYLERHNHVPAWILMKNIEFGKAINLFSLLKNPMKTDIANRLLPDSLKAAAKIEFLINALNLIRQFRNKIAHNLKFVTFKIHRNLLPGKTMRKLLPAYLYGASERKAEIGRSDLYAVILAMIVLLRNDIYLESEFVLSIEKYISLADEESGNDKTTPLLYKHYSKITGLPKDLSLKLKEFHKDLTDEFHKI